MNLPPYCSGQHLCQICHEIYQCEGEEMFHVSRGGNGRCRGEYEQFCPNHTPRQYLLMHRRLGDI